MSMLLGVTRHAECVTALPVDTMKDCNRLGPGRGKLKSYSRVNTPPLSESADSGAESMTVVNPSAKGTTTPVCG